MNVAEIKLEQLLMPYPGYLVKLAQELRKYFLKTNPRYELIGQSRSLNIGYSYTKKAWDSYAAIIVYSKHINISFPSGAFIDDPNSLLIGEGKRVRHIKVNSIEEMHNPKIIDLIQKAQDLALDQLEMEMNKDEMCQTIFKLQKAKK